jgi:hypothetical protein
MASSKNRLSTSSKLLLPENFRSWSLIITFPTAFVLGTWGYLDYHFEGEAVSLSNAMYHSAQLFLLHAPHFGPPVPWMLEVARWLAATSTGLVLFNAAIHISHHRWMRIKLRLRHNHVIVCGLGRRGIAVVEKLYETKIRIVAIDLDPEPEIVERLHSLGIPLIIGDATRIQILRQARTKYANKLYSICPDDTTNLSIALAAQKISCYSGTDRRCYIHINDTELRKALQTNYMGNQPNTEQKLHFFDSYDSQAVQLLTHELPLDHEGILPNDSKQVHLIILGFGNMGRTIAVKAAQLGQFANRKNLRISVIDRKADVNQSALLFHHPYIGDVADFEFSQQEVLSPETRSLVEKWCCEAEMMINLVICFDNPSIAFDTLLNLLPLFKKINVRVAVRINETASFDFLLKGAGVSKKTGFNIRPFGMEKEFENLIDPGRDEAEQFAIDIHKAYVGVIREEFKNDQGELDNKEKSGELNPWETLREDFRESNRQQALHMYFKLRACGFEIVGDTDSRPAILEFAP